MSQYNVVHKFIPMPQAMKIPDGKPAVDKEWKKLATIPAWNLEQVKSKRRLFWELKETQRKSSLLRGWNSVISDVHEKVNEWETSATLRQSMRVIISEESEIRLSVHS